MSPTAVDLRQSLAGSWELDPVHSTVGFEVSYLSGTFKGQFRDAQATLVVRDGKASLEGSARVASVDVKDENLSAHLQSPEFFDAERYPELLFSAEDIELGGETVSASGRLTIKGATKPVEVTGTLTAPMVDSSGRERIGLVLSDTVNRHDFGVDFNLPLPSGEPAIGDEVKIVAELYFIRGE
jgi:polyisoprenoid-binding protein YceI